MRLRYTVWFFLGVIAFGAQAQEAPTRLSAYYAKAQFAGSIGLVSVGVGRQAFNSRLANDLSFGYLPKSFGGDYIYTAAAKSTFYPIRSRPLRQVDWLPVTMGLQLSYTFGDDYFASERFLSRYPNRYYKFSTALRFYIFTGGEVQFTRVPKLERLGAYYEFGTIGEHVIAYIQNPNYLSPAKIVNLALGVKMRL